MHVKVNVMVMNLLATPCLEFGNCGSPQAGYCMTFGAPASTDAVWVNQSQNCERGWFRRRPRAVRSSILRNTKTPNRVVAPWMQESEFVNGQTHHAGARARGNILGTL